MKKFLGLTTLLILISQSSFANTVEVLDIDRYLGLWHQIATIPQSFSKDCVQNTTAEYEKLENGLLKVLNSCEKANSEIEAVEGRARVNAEFNMNSKLEVTFVRFFSQWIFAFAGDYWVINLDEDYQWSIVGNPDKDALWILSRSKTMDKTTLENLRQFIEGYGYDTCTIIMSKNAESPYLGDERLCDIQL